MTTAEVTTETPMVADGAATDGNNGADVGGAAAKSARRTLASNLRPQFLCGSMLDANVSVALNNLDDHPLDVGVIVHEQDLPLLVEEVRQVAAFWASRYADDVRRGRDDDDDDDSDDGDSSAEGPIEDCTVVLLTETGGQHTEYINAIADIPRARLDTLHAVMRRALEVYALNVQDCRRPKPEDESADDDDGGVEDDHATEAVDEGTAAASDEQGAGRVGATVPRAAYVSVAIADEDDGSITPHLDLPAVIREDDLPRLVSAVRVVVAKLIERYAAGVENASTSAESAGVDHA